MKKGLVIMKKWEQLKELSPRERLAAMMAMGSPPMTPTIDILWQAYYDFLKRSGYKRPTAIWVHPEIYRQVLCESRQREAYFSVFGVFKEVNWSEEPKLHLDGIPIVKKEGMEEPVWVVDVPVCEERKEPVAG